MNEKIFYPAVTLIALLMIAFSLVWPQGQGAVSPKPFGHALEWPDYYRMTRDRDARHKRQVIEKAQREQETASSSSSSAKALRAAAK